MRKRRVQVLLEPEERERFAHAADRCGESLSTWLRRAGQALLLRESHARVGSVAELRAFFDTCKGRDGGTPEPSWEQHKRAIESSRNAS